MDQQSPERNKANFFDLMPDPYTERTKFDSWLEDLLSRIDRVPKGYEIREQEYSSEELLNILRGQVRSQVYEQWTKPYVHPKNPNIRREPETAESIKSKLREATSDFISEERTELS